MRAGLLPPIMLIGAGPEMVLSLRQFQVLAGEMPSCSTPRRIQHVHMGNSNKPNWQLRCTQNLCLPGILAQSYHLESLQSENKNISSRKVSVHSLHCNTGNLLLLISRSPPPKDHKYLQCFPMRLWNVNIYTPHL